MNFFNNYHTMQIMYFISSDLVCSFQGTSHYFSKFMCTYLVSLFFFYWLPNSNISDFWCLWFIFALFFVNIAIGLSTLLYLKIQLFVSLIFCFNCIYFSSIVFLMFALGFLFFFSFIFHLIEIHNHLLIYYYSQPFPISNKRS